MVPFILVGCNQKKEEPITDKEESTIIKNATSADEYLNKKDYKSIAYAYIYRIKEGLQSYESETNGTVTISNIIPLLIKMVKPSILKTIQLPL